MRNGKLVQVYLDVETHAALSALAGRMRRPLAEELRHAIERHLDAPPSLRVPPLPAVPTNGRAIAQTRPVDPEEDDMPF